MRQPPSPCGGLAQPTARLLHRCAMVLFQRWSQAEQAAEALNGKANQLLGQTRPLVVHFANPRRNPQGPPEPGIAPHKLFVGQARRSPLLWLQRPHAPRLLALLCVCRAGCRSASCSLGGPSSAPALQQRALHHGHQSRLSLPVPLCCINPWTLQTRVRLPTGASRRGRRRAAPALRALRQDRAPQHPAHPAGPVCRWAAAPAQPPAAEPCLRLHSLVPPAPCLWACCEHGSSAGVSATGHHDVCPAAWGVCAPASAARGAADSAAWACRAGCAFVQFSKWAEAEDAKDAHNGKTRLPGADAPLVVHFADAKKRDSGAGLLRNPLDMWQSGARRPGGDLAELAGVVRPTRPPNSVPALNPLSLWHPDHASAVDRGAQALQHAWAGQRLPGCLRWRKAAGRHHRLAQGAAYNYMLAGLGRPGGQLASNGDAGMGGLLASGNGLQAGGPHLGGLGNPLGDGGLGDGLVDHMDQLHLDSMPLQGGAPHQQPPSSSCVPTWRGALRVIVCSSVPQLTSDA